MKRALKEFSWQIAAETDKSYPLTNKWIQEDYLNASQKYGITLQSIHLYTLVRQGYIRSSLRSQEGKDRHGKHKEGDYRSLWK